MYFKTGIEPYTLQFRNPAGTSRGVYQIHKVWFVRIYDLDNPDHFGMGECAPLPDLSCDDLPGYEEILKQACKAFELSGVIDYEALRPYPSILFGLETALRHFERSSYALWDTPFSRGEKGIPINGLIWMGEYRQMAEQIEEKIRLGFKCIKLKIGAINFEEELGLLRQIRQRFSPDMITLRVDANGAFSPEEAPEKLLRLSRLGLHSIEQPIRAGQWEDMAVLTASTPLPIALDEELIGCNAYVDKRAMLQAIKPQYIILKPTLHGGFKGCTEWIEIAESLHIGWWITSALESNIGLNAVAQWCATLGNPMHQGLGTGLLYTNNIDMPLSIEGEQLWFDRVNREPASALPLTHQSSRTNVGSGMTHHRRPGPDSLLKQSEQTKEEGKPTIKIEGIFFSPENISLAIKNKACSDFQLELFRFLEDWFSPSEEMTIHTSGSTGKPKPVVVKKRLMEQSAKITCKYLGLQLHDKILLCMPLSFIAGKMMVVRALVAGLDIYPIAPSGHPLSETGPDFEFAAMVPLQIFNSLQVPAEQERLRKIRTLLIGGGAIDSNLEEALKDFSNPVYASYGMAETLSHIALRRVNGPNASLNFTPLPSVHLSLSEEGTLVIDAPLVCDKILYTNDIAEICPDATFRIFGRKDNVIVTGGLKVQTETLEATLSAFIHVPFAISSLPDVKFGEIIVLATEQPVEEKQWATLLPSYQIPKKIITIKTIPRTESGKIDRAALKEMLVSDQTFEE